MKKSSNVLRVGIVSKKLEKSFGIQLPYLNFGQEMFPKLSKKGLVDVVSILPTSKVLVENIDLLIIPGGLDVDSKRFGESPNFNNTRTDPWMEWFDNVMLPQYLELAEQNKLAILGICRGFQTICVHYGSVMSQDIAQEKSYPRSERTDELQFISENFESGFLWRKNAKNRLVHNFNTVSNLKSSGLYSVNSLHHQGIAGYEDDKGNWFSDDLSDAIVPLAYNDEYKNLEVATVAGLPVTIVQYHPEEFFCRLTIKLIRNNLRTINHPLFSTSKNLKNV